MNEITMLRDLRPVPPPAELDALRLATRQQFVAGTASKRTGPRWRMPVLAGGLTAAAAATASGVLVLTSSPAAVPGQHPTAGHAGTVVTTAWTVHEYADGTVTIYLRQYADPDGLQRTLRADGINAIVRPIPWVHRTVVLPVAGHQQKKAGNHALPGTAAPTCVYAHTDNAPAAVQHAAVTIVQQAIPAYFIIRPAKIPHTSALFLAFMANVPAGSGTSNLAMKPVVLRSTAVPACVPVRLASKSGPAPELAPKVKTRPTAAPKAP